MAAVVNTGMSKGEMRKLLLRSKEEPVSCAVGVGGDIGLLMLHKTRGPKVLEKALKDEFSDVKSLRFGTAFVDVETNPKLVKLQLNRAAPGIGRKLIKTLKGTGFTKVQIVSDDGESESYEEADEDAPAEAVAAASSTEPETGPAVAAVPPAPPPPAVGPSPAETAAQAAALAKLLTELATTIPAAAGDDDARKAKLMKLATDANVNIKTGNLKTAAGFLAQLKAALAELSAAKANPVVALAKAKLAWNGVRQQVSADVETLRAALAATYEGQSFSNEVITKFQEKVGPIMTRFDDRLGDALEEMAGETDPDQRATLVAAAKAVAKDYLSFAMSDPLIGDLDNNPFVSLTIRSKTTAALAAVAKSIQ